MKYISEELDSWLDKEYLKTIEKELTVLDDYVPKTIELHFSDYDARCRYLDLNEEMVRSDEYQIKQIIDQRAKGATWEERVTIFDEFFERHPEYSKLIKDKEAYEKWRVEEVDY